MTRTPHPSPAAGGRLPLRRSFAFRLGVAFALVAAAGAGITALAVNAAFAARFDTYLRSQQHAQVSVITAALSHAYAGQGKWDLRALDAVVPVAGSGTVRVLTPPGGNVWQWNGHTLSWNSKWMQSTSQASGNKSSHAGSGNSGSSGSGTCNGWEHCGSWDSGHHDMGNPGSGNWGSGNWGSAPLGGTSPPATRLMAYRLPAPAASPSATSSPVTGHAERAAIMVNGKVAGYALIALPPPAGLPQAAAVRSELIGVVLAAGAAGALISVALGIFFARRATRPLRDMTAAARAVAAGEPGHPG